MGESVVGQVLLVGGSSQLISLRERIAELFPGVTDRRLRQVTWPEIDKHRDYIVEQLGKDVSMATISQRLRDDHGVVASESSVRRWLEGNLAEEVARRKASPTQTRFRRR